MMLEFRSIIYMLTHRVRNGNGSLCHSPEFGPESVGKFSKQNKKKSHQKRSTEESAIDGDGAMMVRHIQVFHRFAPFGVFSSWKPSSTFIATAGYVLGFSERGLTVLLLVAYRSKTVSNRILFCLTMNVDCCSSPWNARLNVKFGFCAYFH